MIHSDAVFKGLFIDTNSGVAMFVLVHLRSMHQKLVELCLLGYNSKRRRIHSRHEGDMRNPTQVVKQLLEKSTPFSALRCRLCDQYWECCFGTTGSRTFTYVEIFSDVVGLTS